MMAVDRVPRPGFRFDGQSFTVSLLVAETPAGPPLIGLLKSGRLACAATVSDRPDRPGDVFLAIQPERPHLARSIDTGAEVAVMDLALVSQVAAGTRNPARPPVRFTGHEPVSARAARTWRAAYAYVHDTVLANPGPGTSPVVVYSAARLLAAITLTTFPNTAIAAPRSDDEPGPHPGAVQSAVTYMDEHAHQDITVADIAAAATVTARTLQLAFRRHLDTTPMTYLRQVRLDRAHQDLRQGGSATTVSAVAHRWGFPSPGRFAAHYRRAYGTTPGLTLRQR
jgi:AraC-like DNA-binding protein